MTDTKRIIDYGERAFAVLLSIPFVIAFVSYLPTHPYTMCLFLTEALSVVLILIRKPGEISEKPYPLLIAFIGTSFPLLARPGSLQIAPDLITSTLMISGLLISVSAKLFLNRSFGLIAANRGIKRGGPYRLVRHPMYLGYIITQAGFFLSAASWNLLGLYIIAWTAQILRIIEEEKFLMQDADYRDFARSVPRRLVPGF